MKSQKSWIEVFKVFLKLGLTSFGGPIAHLGYFRNEIVGRRKWMDEAAYADLIALCQFLPGPASSQVGIAIGLSRAGYGGAIAAWLGFTAPSAIALVLFAYGMTTFGAGGGTGWLQGLKVAAVAVVAQAVWVMGQKLTPDRKRLIFAILAAVLVIAAPTAWGQIGAIVSGALSGSVLLKNYPVQPYTKFHHKVSRRVAIFCLVLFAVLLAGLPVLAALLPVNGLKMFDSFYRAGSLVFGGGHVVLPLLQAGVVNPGWVTKDAFLAGYGAAQAVPGPLFTFAAYLGAVMRPEPNGWAGAILCLTAIFLPSFLLVIGVLPFWETLRKYSGVQAAMRGVNAAVVGILLAALYHPVWTSGILSAKYFILAVAAFLLLEKWKTPPWLVVALCAAGGAVLAFLN
jgi:chromate transporter